MGKFWCNKTETDAEEETKQAEDQLICLLDLFYTKSETEYITFEQLLTATPISHFLKKLPEDKIKTLITAHLRLKYDFSVVSRKGKYHTLVFFIIPLFETGRDNVPGPSVADPAKSLDGLIQHPMGSKVVMRKEVAGLPYAHCGILIKLGAHSYIAEIGKYNNRTKLLLNPAWTVLEQGYEVQIDNRYLVNYGIETSSLIYRLIMVLNCEIQYDPALCNCDVLATFIVTGNAKWTTKTKKTERIEKIIKPLPLPRIRTSKKINLEKLVQIQSEHPGLNRIAVKEVLLED